ncbi:MAG: response regulator [Oligoflexia bacterium]|nr:response regulator [Oligoflexia bacterium]
MIFLTYISIDSELIKLIKASTEPVSNLKVIDGVGTFKEFLEAYRNIQYDIVIIDLFLPEKNGLDLIGSIRKTNEDITIILIDKINSKHTVERAFRLGASDVIPYPTNEETLSSTIYHRVNTLLNESN